MDKAPLAGDLGPYPDAAPRVLAGPDSLRNGAASYDEGGLRVRRFDPQRKDRIVDAALSVIAEHGIAGASLRKIALRADVPLGSLTYHFAGMHELLVTAFGRFVRLSLTRLENRLNGSSDSGEAGQAILEMIREDGAENPPDSLTLAREFQAMVVRDPSCREIAQDWIRLSSSVLERYFDPSTAGILEALIEGLTLRENMLTRSASGAVAGDAIRRLLAVPPGKSNEPTAAPASRGRT